MRPRAILVSAALLASTLFPAKSDELSGTLRKIKEIGEIKLGFRETLIPFSYLDDKQQPVGFSMDLCYAIADAVKKRLGDKNIRTELVAVAPAARIALLANGTIDLDCGANTNTVERQKVVAFGDTMFITSPRYVSKKIKNLHTIDDLKGKTVVSTSGATNMKQLVEANAQRKLGMAVLTGKDHAEGFLLVESGRADAFAMDDILLAGFIAASKDPNAYEISSEAFSTPEPYGIMLRKDDAPFKSLVDQTMSALYKGPEIVALYDKWFTKPIPPKGINLQFPIGQKLSKAFAHPTDSPDASAY
ncbi:amino acid ABC transporter substrate-binding protein [Methylobacterium sp. NMS14P]|uniref:amino acid ABC transporter substrate-binding protein n=1 Tax=Methylobacterium sp. NMS14P TaxID=2894310 RepID=UPI0023597438|nr:amino acid ABC transporter substrate-binding protein [Methylobacterium sp. NMS14P]WCS25700.1 amino acid ABC transporter substrate-binding protein [Methylobacterium sp. NMS14P]